MIDWEQVVFMKVIVLRIQPEGSKSNIPCCAQHFHDTRATCTQILRVTFPWHMRQIHAVCPSHPRIRRKCCAHLPREKRATRDVNFGPFCISLEILGNLDRRIWQIFWSLGFPSTTHKVLSLQQGMLIPLVFRINLFRAKLNFFSKYLSPWRVANPINEHNT
jgi:hypothetical protein